MSDKNITIWQRLGRAMGPDALMSQDFPVYKFDKKELLRTTDKAEYEKEKLQARQTSYLAGQFAKVDYEPPMKLRDFYVFPYDMRHCVYPFNGTNETRRTLAANCDVLYNPIINRGAQ